MGISSITQLIKWLQKNYPQTQDIVETVDLSAFSGQTWAIDGSNYIYRYKYQSNRPGAHLDGFLRLFILLYQYNITPILIFDGTPPTEKQATLKARRQRRYQQQKTHQDLQAQLEDPNLRPADKVHIRKKIRQLEKTMVTFQDTDFQEITYMCQLLAIPVFRAQGEADALCAYLAREKSIQAVISSDYDMLMYQCPCIIKQINYRNNSVDIIRLEHLLKQLQLESHQKFIELCLLLGTDYTSDKIAGIGPITAWKELVKQQKDLKTICQQRQVSPSTLQQFINAYKLITGAHLQESLDASVSLKRGCPQIQQLRTFLQQKVNYRPTTLNNYLRKLVPKIVVPLKVNVNKCTSTSVTSSEECAD